MSRSLPSQHFYPEPPSPHFITSYTTGRKSAVARLPRTKENNLSKNDLSRNMNISPRQTRSNLNMNHEKEQNIEPLNPRENQLPCPHRSKSYNKAVRAPFKTVNNNTSKNGKNNKISRENTRNPPLKEYNVISRDTRVNYEDNVTSRSNVSTRDDEPQEIEDIFSNLEDEIAWSISLCDKIFSDGESGSGLSDDDQLSPPEEKTSGKKIRTETPDPALEANKDGLSRNTDSVSMDTDTMDTVSMDTVSMDTELRTSYHVWYQPDLSREHAEELLAKQPIGTFYIRSSSKADHYALSVHISSTTPRVEHYLVLDKGKVLQMDNSTLEFPNFVELLAFFTQSKTYSATTGIPVQLKIPRLITTSAHPSSVYDQIDLEPREHTQSTDRPKPDISKVPDYRKSCEKFSARKSHSPPPSRSSFFQPTLTARPKSVHVSNPHFVFPDMRDPKQCEAPPKPPKPKNYRCGNNYNCPDEKDLIYINLDKSPGKMIDVLAPLVAPLVAPEQNNLSETDTNKRCRSGNFVHSADNIPNKNIKLNKKYGPAIFYAPPPPPSEENPQILAPSSKDNPLFIAPSPPASPPTPESGSGDESDHLSSSIGSLYSSKHSMDLGHDSWRSGMTRTGRPSSVMEKVKSRVFKLDRPSRQSVRAKLCVKLSAHILRLTDTRDFTFQARVNTFVTFVKQQHEKKPDRLLLQIREFMCNLKHEMMSARSDALEDMLARAQRKGPHPKINDIIEGVLVKAVIYPLRSYITKVLNEYDEEEAIQLKNSMTVALSKTYEQLGINKEMFCGYELDWTVPVQCLQDIANHYSPIKKLERLLACVNSIYTIIRDTNLERTGKPRSMGADEFLPLFIYVLALSGSASAGQEMMYMQGLLDPPLLIGEPGYYLTTLASSIMLLKSLDFDKPHHVLPTVGHLQSMLQIYFTDSDMQQIAYKTLPVNQNTTTGDLISNLTSKFRLDNEAEYALFKVEDGQETQLMDQECPQFIKNQWLVESLERDINSYFAFHRKR